MNSESGGPEKMQGINGRKLDSDLFGNQCSLGNAALSGRDPSKVEKLATLYARYITKSLVYNGLCHRA